jgi:hypothetical protein
MINNVTSSVTSVFIIPRAKEERKEKKRIKCERMAKMKMSYDALPW